MPVSLCGRRLGRVLAGWCCMLSVALVGRRGGAASPSSTAATTTWTLLSIGRCICLLFLSTTRIGASAPVARCFSFIGAVGCCRGPFGLVGSLVG